METAHGSHFWSVPNQFRFSGALASRCLTSVGAEDDLFASLLTVDTHRSTIGFTTR